MSRYLTNLPAAVVRLAVVVAILIVAGGCSQSTKSGEKTNTGVLTGYELGNEQDFTDGRRDRIGHRDFD